MFKVPMPPIKRKWQGKYLYIPGGWMAQIPRIEIEDCVLNAWALYLRQSGIGVIESLEAAKEIGQDVYVAGYRVGLLTHTSYWAKKYYKMFPESVRAIDPHQEIYSLDGFDPEIVQSSYVPFHRVGRKGQPFMNNMLREMYDADM